MVQIWLQQQRIQEAVCPCLEVGLVVMRESEINNCAHVVGAQVNCQLVGLDALWSL